MMLIVLLASKLRSIPSLRKFMLTYPKCPVTRKMYWHDDLVVVEYVDLGSKSFDK